MPANLPRSPRPAIEACLFCGAEELLPYALGVRDHLRIAPRRHDFYRCRRCGSLRLVPLPGKEYLERCYPQECHFHRESGKGLRKWWNLLEWRLFYQPVLRRSQGLITRRTEVPSGKVLDLGCGNGLRLLQYARAGYETEGIDFGLVNVKYARDVLGLKVRQGDIEETDLPANRYDLLTVYWVVEHLSQPQRLVEKVMESLAPEGWAVFAVPLADSWISLLFRSHWGQVRESPRHIGIPSSGGMFRLLEDAGLVDISMEPASFLELAGDVALTLWPRGNFYLTTGRRAILKIIDRLAVALLTLAVLPPVLFFNQAGARPGLALFFGRKRAGGGEISPSPVGPPG